MDRAGLSVSVAGNRWRLATENASPALPCAAEGGHMRIGLRGIAIALLLTACEPYDCGDDLDYSPREHRCVCPEGFAETDGGVCITVDAGPLACPGDAE